MVRGASCLPSALCQVTLVMNGPVLSASSSVRPTRAGAERVGRITMGAPAQGCVTGTS